MADSSEARPFNWWVWGQDGDENDMGRLTREIAAHPWAVFSAEDDALDTPPVAVCLGRSADGDLICTGLIVGLSQAYPHGAGKRHKRPDVEVTSRSLRGVPVAELIGRAIPMARGEQNNMPEWMVERILGRVPDLPQVKRNPGPKGHGDEHFRNVAAWYRRAVDEHPRAPMKWLAEQLHADRATVNRWVQRARDKGYLGEAIPGRAGERTGGEDDYQA